MIPERCPFCAFNYKYLVNPAEFFNYQVSIEDLDDKEVRDIITSFELEIENINFYKEAEEQVNNLELESYFRHLRRHEEYHRDELADIIGVNDYNTIEVEEISLPSRELDIFEKAIRVEKEAIEFYESAREYTNNGTLKYIYDGLIEAEKYHIEIFEWLQFLYQNRGEGN